ncbi:hypothetical protein TSTA_109970 [Talaromyces stipitatus ATCC 10500]|uniref:Endonuclease/exonuclease/phosphatase domain-containing protein n=1 Tax=Talaromyces stipitatus (strain ATCC 10500 / CBS 375.48 / QM 6759 / NRRL 1006) TaxID=441959 RepID=B8MUS9_TALSN|nr:uncharacterized protein TSTA_109970 [Talaromyces stipitatus ATCC 10500]EED11817.1 hypothetical protein TSTA_109970 [Talaromyces stipitatus ATCC 10500]
MLWVNKDVEAEQVLIESPDLTAAVIRLPERLIFMALVYVEHGDAQALRDTCNHLRKAITKGGGQGGDYESTIDLVLASENLIDSMVKCAIHGTEHGSDHRAIKTVFDVPRPDTNHRERLLLKNAPWKEINARIAQNLDSTPAEGTLQQRTDRLMSVVLEAVHTLTPKAKPSLYAKRWWTSDLTQLHYIYTYWRNHTRLERQAGRDVTHLEEMAKSASKQYHDAIQQQKKKH